MVWMTVIPSKQHFESTDIEGHTAVATFILLVLDVTAPRESSLHKAERQPLITML